MIPKICGTTLAYRGEFRVTCEAETLEAAERYIQHAYGPQYAVKFLWTDRDNANAHTFFLRHRPAQPNRPSFLAALLGVR